MSSRERAEVGIACAIFGALAGFGGGYVAVLTHPQPGKPSELGTYATPQPTPCQHWVTGPGLHTDQSVTSCYP
jgi:hypothetical protein